jgi:hypothetical protein
MKTHVDSAHPWLVEKKKLILIEKSMAKGFEANRIQQSKKKKVEPFGLTIGTFFGSTNLNKHGDEPHQRFCKDYQPLSTCENI